MTTININPTSSTQYTQDQQDDDAKVAADQKFQADLTAFESVPMTDPDYQNKLDAIYAEADKVDPTGELKGELQKDVNGKDTTFSLGMTFINAHTASDIRDESLQLQTDKADAAATEATGFLTTEQADSKSDMNLDPTVRVLLILSNATDSSTSSMDTVGDLMTDTTDKSDAVNAQSAVLTALEPPGTDDNATAIVSGATIDALTAAGVVLPANGLTKNADGSYTVTQKAFEDTKANCATATSSFTALTQKYGLEMSKANDQMNELMTWRANIQSDDHQTKEGIIQNPDRDRSRIVRTPLDLWRCHDKAPARAGYRGLRTGDRGLRVRRRQHVRRLRPRREGPGSDLRARLQPVQPGALAGGAPDFQLPDVPEPPGAAVPRRAGACLQMLGRHDDALRAYLLAHVLDVSEPTVALHIAECLIALHRKDDARTALETVVALTEEDVAFAPIRSRAQALASLVQQ